MPRKGAIQRTTENKNRHYQHRVDRIETQGTLKILGFRKETSLEESEGSIIRGGGKPRLKPSGTLLGETVSLRAANRLRGLLSKVPIGKKQIGTVKSRGEGVYLTKQQQRY